MTTALPAQLIKAANDGQLAIFIGAGVSLSAGMPLASEIAEHLFKSLGSPSSQATDQHNLAKMAGYYEAIHGRIHLVREIEKLIGTRRTNNHTPAHLLLARLFKSLLINSRPAKSRIISEVITTNYDTLIEDACIFSGIYPRVVSHPSQLSLYEPGKAPVILKIHGDFASPELLVLTEDDMVSWSTRPEIQQLLGKVRDIFASKHVLFVGSALGDFNILQTILGAAPAGHSMFQRQHFAAMFRDVDLEAHQARFNKYNIKLFHAPDTDEFFKELYLKADAELTIGHLVFNYPAWYPDQQARYGGIETFIGHLQAHSRFRESMFVQEVYTKDMINAFPSSQFTTTSPSYPSSYFFFRAAAKAAVHSLYARLDRGQLLPDVVHMHFLPFAVLSEQAGFPTLCTSHSLLSTDLYYGRGIFDGTCTEGCRFEVKAVADAQIDAAVRVPSITALTKAHQTELENIGAHDVAILPPPFDATLFESGKSPAQTRLEHRIGTADKFTITYVGRPDRRKGIETLVAACSRIAAERGAEFQLMFVGYGVSVHDGRLLVGDGSVYFDLSGLQASGVDIITVTAENSKECRKYYFASDVVVVPSLYEPMGYVVLEAMACGRAVVTSRVGGMVELFEEGREGMAFQAGQISELVGCLKHLIDNPEFRRTLGENAKERSARRPTVQQCVAEWDRLYKERAAAVGTLYPEGNASLQLAARTQCESWLALNEYASLYGLAVAGCSIAADLARAYRLPPPPKEVPIRGYLFRCVASEMYRALRRARRVGVHTSQGLFDCMYDVALAYLNSNRPKRQPMVLDGERTEQLMRK